MTSKKSRILIAAALLLCVTLIVGYSFYAKIFHANVKKSGTVYIPSNSNIDDLKNILAPKLNDVDDFIWVAKKKKYHLNIKAGKYSITEGMSTNDLINYLRLGKQNPVKLTFNNQHSLEALAGRISKQIEADSIAIFNAMTDEGFLKTNGFNEGTAISMYIPNSYQVYWNTSAEQFRTRMLKEYNSFWNQNRISKAQQQNLTIEEVSILASIVQQECQSNISERAMVAGLYLNRYHKKWPLEADPTIIFALKKENGQDYMVKRVLYKDLKIDSPYNTYKNRGIPPGPICMPDISSIEAVLNPVEHNYFFMCASVERFGSHAFAKSLRQHNRNAKKYQKWISKLGVNR